MTATIALSEARPRRADHLAPFKFLSVARTHVGCIRTLNEDAYADRPEIGLWAVADGMGGHARGDVASSALVEALGEAGSFVSAYAFRDSVASAIARVNRSLFENADEETMGTTVVSLLAHNGHFACLWAGDSRAYLHRRGALKRLTRDHSMVQEMVDAGALSSDQAHGHRNANVITRAVGAHKILKLDDAYGAIEAGDRFLLCSDGLHGALSDRDIADIVRRAPLEWAANELIQQALRRGGSDNVTVILVAAERA